MTQDPDAVSVAAALHVSIGLLRWRLRQVRVEGDLSLPERSALARLDRVGPATSSELARIEQISPQSMGATLGVLEDRGLIARRPDPEDGRRAVLSLTESGRKVMQDRRNLRTEHLAKALATNFTRAEVRQLMTAAPLLERLAQSI
jgi:DNA-binding MarR family transcriptional regulator